MRNKRTETLWNQIETTRERINRHIEKVEEMRERGDLSSEEANGLLEELYLGKTGVAGAAGKASSL